MNLAILLITEGGAPADLAPYMARLGTVLQAGDMLIVTDSGSDPDLSTAIEATIQPEFLPPSVTLKVLRFNAVPAGSWGSQRNAALAEASAAAVLLLTLAEPPRAEALNTARRQLEDSKAVLLLAGGAPPPEAASDARHIWALEQTPAPALLRRDWLQEQALRLPESGMAQDWLWHWQICATADPVSWQEEPLCDNVRPAPLPRDPASLLALHQQLCDLDTGMMAPAYGWLIAAMADLTPDLAPEDRWPAAQGLAERFRLCPDRLWPEVLSRQGGSQAAAEADALRRGALPEVTTRWTQAATESRLIAVETALAGLRHDMTDLAALRRMLESLSRIAEFDALSAYRPADSGKPPP